MATRYYNTLDSQESNGEHSAETGSKLKMRSSSRHIPNVLHVAASTSLCSSPLSSPSWSKSMSVAKRCVWEREHVGDYQELAQVCSDASGRIQRRVRVERSDANEGGGGGGGGL